MWGEVNAESGIAAIDALMAYCADTDEYADDETGEGNMRWRTANEAIDHIKRVVEKCGIKADMTLAEIRDQLIRLTTGGDTR
jgi:hypothetical protein